MSYERPAAHFQGSEVHVSLVSAGGEILKPFLLEKHALTIHPIEWEKSLVRILRPQLLRVLRILKEIDSDILRERQYPTAGNLRLGLELSKLIDLVQPSLRARDAMNPLYKEDQKAYFILPYSDVVELNAALRKLDEPSSDDKTRFKEFRRFKNCMALLFGAEAVKTENRWATRTLRMRKKQAYRAARQNDQTGKAIAVARIQKNLTAEAIAADPDYCLRMARYVYNNNKDPQILRLIADNLDLVQDIALARAMARFVQRHDHGTLHTKAKLFESGLPPDLPLGPVLGVLLTPEWQAKTQRNVCIRIMDNIRRIRMYDDDGRMEERIQSIMNHEGITPRMMANLDHYKKQEGIKKEKVEDVNYDKILAGIEARIEKGEADRKKGSVAHIIREALEKCKTALFVPKLPSPRPLPRGNLVRTRHQEIQIAGRNLAKRMPAEIKREIEKIREIDADNYTAARIIRMPGFL